MYIIKHLIFVVVFLAVANSVRAEDHKDISNMSLSELTKVKVFSVSKRSEDANKAAAAVYVIDSEELKRLNVTHVADALRIVPGLQVAQLSGNKWSVSSRGFSEQFSTKLLVLLDGREIFLPIFSGTLWDSQNIMIEDIDRIEVIRGPGATLWGSNAMNGVIHIITKKAQKTLGNYVRASTGNYEHTVAARKGQMLSKNQFIRYYVDALKRGDSKKLNTEDFEDSWGSMRAGFRMDWDKSDKDTFRFQGDISYGEEDQEYMLPTLSFPFSMTRKFDEVFKRAYLTAEWKRNYASNADFNLIAYADYVERRFSVLRYKGYNVKVDIQNSWDISDRDNLLLGASQKIEIDDLSDTIFLDYEPNSNTNSVTNAFAQYSRELIRDSLTFTAGSKIEHNDFTGFHAQPSAKLSWQINRSHMMWASVARALRTASRGTHGLDIRLRGTPFGYIATQGDSGFEPEEVITREVGYRYKNRKLSLDVALFHNDYDDLRTFEPGVPSGDIFLPLHIANNGKADTSGVEVAAKWKVSPKLELSASYAYIHLDFAFNSPSNDPTFLIDEGKSPKHQYNIRAHYKLTKDVSWNTALFYIDETPALGVDNYYRLDTNVNWQITDNLKASVVATNVTEPYHQEYSAALYSEPSRLPRSIFLKLSRTF